MALTNGSDKTPQKPSHHFSIYFYNWITYLGVLLSITLTVVEVFLFAFEFQSGRNNVYLGIYTYGVLPIFLILGLVLIPIGALWKRRLILKKGVSAIPRTLFIDPSIATHRNAIFVFLIGSALFLIMTGIGTYKSYKHTESVEFCGLTCHDAMKPEHTTYMNSPHARVKCVDCHIGEGADWYIKAKMTGLRHLYHKVRNDYPRPIPAPLQKLRPAVETCERCHWPDKSYSSKEIKRTYYSAFGSEQPEWLLRMMVHVGATPEKNEGIHAHMYLDNDIYFAAEDEMLQKISWIKSVDKQGNAKIFTSADSPWAGTTPPEEALRKMDCMDCHNRPTHRYLYPSKLLNTALAAGKIDATLPDIKSKAMELLSKEYASETQALESIGQELRDFYKTSFGTQYNTHQLQVENAVASIRELFKTNMFPEMKARWDAYPDNIGHLVSSGCFRCHDGEHTSEQGEVITKDCNVCHTIIEQGPPGALETSTQGLNFVHPFEDDGLWKDMNCTDCHTGN